MNYINNFNENTHDLVISVVDFDTENVIDFTVSVNNLHIPNTSLATDCEANRCATKEEATAIIEAMVGEWSARDEAIYWLDGFRIVEA